MLGARGDGDWCPGQRRREELTARGGRGGTAREERGVSVETVLALADATHCCFECWSGVEVKRVNWRKSRDEESESEFEAGRPRCGGRRTRSVLELAISVGLYSFASCETASTFCFSSGRPSSRSRLRRDAFTTANGNSVSLETAATSNTTATRVPPASTLLLELELLRSSLRCT